jgi:hypothetical protein
MWERGGIGRHDGLKIRCLVIGVRVQVPPLPINLKINFKLIASQEIRLIYL